MISIKELNISPNFRMSFHSPEGVLSQFVSSIWVSEGTPPFSQERIVPDGECILLFNFGKSLRSYDLGNIIDIKKMLFCGVFTHYTTIEYPKISAEHNQMGILFKPGGAYHLFQENMSIYKNIAVDVQHLSFLNDWYEQLEICSSASAKIARLVQFLTQNLIKNYNPSAFSVQNLIYKIAKTPNQSIDDIVQNTGYTAQHINRLLGKYAGMNIKGFQKIFRIQQAKHLINSCGGTSSLTDITYQTAYYDQAHFIHDFQEMMGMSPKVFRQNNNNANRRVIYL